MPSIPPILHPDQVTTSLLDDMRDASHTYWTEYSYTKAFDHFVKDRKSAAVLAEYLQGKASATDTLQCMRDGFLGKWGSVRSLTKKNCPGIVKALDRSASLFGNYSADAGIDSLTDAELERLVAAFEVLDRCTGIGATIASKILAAFQPAAAVMWDMPIAAAYGFAHSAAGYRRFLQLVRAFAARIRALSDGTDLEAYVKPKGRDWQVPLAKVIDEWHWVRITREHRYRPQRPASD